MLISITYLFPHEHSLEVVFRTWLLYFLNFMNQMLLYDELSSLNSAEEHLNKNWVCWSITRKLQSNFHNFFIILQLPLLFSLTFPCRMRMWSSHSTSLMKSSNDNSTAFCPRSLATGGACDITRDFPQPDVLMWDTRMQCLVYLLLPQVGTPTVDCSLWCIACKWQDKVVFSGTGS